MHRGITCDIVEEPQGRVRAGSGPGRGRGRAGPGRAEARAAPGPRRARLLPAALLEHILQGGGAARVDLLVGDLFGGGQQVGGLRVWRRIAGP